MLETKARLSTVDPVWRRVSEEAEEAIRNEPLLGGLIHSGLLHHATMERALAYRFSAGLGTRAREVERRNMGNPSNPCLHGQR